MVEYTIEESNAYSLLCDLDKAHFIDADKFRNIVIDQDEVSFEWVCDGFYVKFKADCKNGHPWQYSYEQSINGSKTSDVKEATCGYAILTKIVELTNCFANYCISTFSEGYGYSVHANGSLTEVPHVTLFDTSRNIICVVGLSEEIPTSNEDIKVLQGELPSNFCEWANAIDTKFTLKKWELSNIVYDISVMNKKPVERFCK